MDAFGALLLVLSGPASVVLGIYTNDSFIIWFGAIHTSLYALFFFMRFRNIRREQKINQELLRKQLQLIEQFADEQERKSKG